VLDGADLRPDGVQALRDLAEAATQRSV
jgi:hypothetical protein